MAIEELFGLLFEPLGLTERDVVVVIVASTLIGYFYWKMVCKHESVLHSRGPDDAFLIEITGFVWIFRWLLYAKLVTIWVSEQLGGVEIILLIPMLSLAIWSDYYAWFGKNPVRWHVSISAPVDLYRSLFRALKRAAKDVMRYHSISRQLLKQQVRVLVLAGVYSFFIIPLLIYLVESLIVFRMDRVLVALLFVNAIMLIMFYFIACKDSLFVRGIKMSTLSILSFVAMFVVVIIFDSELVRLFLLDPIVLPYFIGSLLVFLPVNSVIVAMFVKGSRSREA